MKTEAKKNKIIQSAGECFARYGYDKTTLDDIGKLAKLNKASLYYYFKNKEDIFIQVILRESEVFIQALQEKAKNYEGAENKIINYLSERLTYYNEVLNLHQLSVESLQKIEPLFSELYQMVFQKEIEFISVLLESGIKNKEFTNHNHQEVAESILMVADALKRDASFESKAGHVIGINYVQISEKIKSIVLLILRGLKVL